MRLDKYLKEARIIKRRTISNALCDNDKVLVNGIIKKANYSVKVDDEITIHYGDNVITHKVLVEPYEKKSSKKKN